MADVAWFYLFIYTCPVIFKYFMEYKLWYITMPRLVLFIISLVWTAKMALVKFIQAVF